MTQATEGWSARYTKVVAAEVRRYREECGLSAQQFADACTEAGLPMKRSIIANFENGRRATVSIDELLVFAKVLKVPPIYLMLPVGRADETEVLPGAKMDTYRAALWLSGSLPFDKSDGYEVTKSLPLPKYRHIVLELGYLQEVTENLEAAQIKYEDGMTVEEAERAADQALKAASQALEEADEVVFASIQASKEGDAAVAAETDRRKSAVMQNLHRLQREAEVASNRRVSVGNRYHELESWRRDRERIEDAIRGDLNELRSAGWKLPGLSEEYQYLLEPVKSERRRPGRA